MLWDNLITSIVINNRHIGNIKSSVLFEQEIEIPNIQRIRDDSKVEEIINFQLDFFKEKKQFNFLGTINIHYCKENNLYFLVDGQHRYESLKRLFNNMGHDIEICIEIVCVNNLEELKSNYKLVNKNTSLPEFPDSIDKNIPEKVALYFKDKYPSIWSKNSRARRPHIYFNFFQESLGILTKELEINDHKQLQNIIEEYNSKLKNWNISQFPHPKDINENMRLKCQEIGLYLGLFKHISDEYGYKWVQSIIYNEKGVVIKDKKKKYKQRIPKKIKVDSWNKYVGKDIKRAPCICCRNTIIDSFDYQAGHIISEKNGGNISVENILPICIGCNQSMGIQNMNEFIKEYYPNNEEYFLKKSYKEKQNWNWGISIMA